MNRKETEELKKQQVPSTKRRMFFEEYGAAPLAAIFRNPKVTPTILFIFALAPLAIAAVVLTLVYLWQ